MGASGIITQLIIFIAVISTATSVVVLLKGQVDRTSYSILLEQSDIVDGITTDLTIEVINFDNSTDPDTTTLYIKNTGRTLLDPDEIHIFIDGVRIPNNSSNLTKVIPDDVNEKNANYLDPKEILEVNVFRNLNSSKSHEAFVSTKNGFVETKEFNA